jgi:hypothetical protein
VHVTKELPDEQYTPEETKRRFEAAIRGARLASPQPMKEIVGDGKGATIRSKNRMTVRAKPKLR